MRPRVPASVAICAVFATVHVVHADGPARRQVAVIDLSEDDAVKALSTSIYRALNLSEVLRVPDRRELETALTGPLLDEDGTHIQNARDDRGRAENELFTNYDAKQAGAEAGNGEIELQKVTPTDETRALYAQLSLLRGLALLDQHEPGGAARAFALTHRIDPATQLDPTRYPPDIIDAFQRAATAPAQTAPLVIRGTGRAWIDGRERGDAPDSFDVEIGDHYIVLTGADRDTTGVPVTVGKKPTVAEIEDAPAEPALQVGRARLALSRAVAKADDAARAGAMQELAALLGVGDAVLISKRADGKLQFETWRDRAPGFSPPQLYVSQKPEVLLEGLAPAWTPVKPPVDDSPPSAGGISKPLVPQPEQPWYERRWVQASAAIGLAAIIVGAILWARRDENVSINHDIMSGM